MGNLLELSLHSQLLVLSIYHGNVFQPCLSFCFLFSFVLSSPNKFGRYAYGCIELFNGQKPYRRVVCLSGASINWMIISSLFAYSSSFASIKKKVLLYGAQCDKGSWQFTPPIVGFRCWQACRLCSHFVYAHGVGT